MTRDQLKSKFPHISESCLRANAAAESLETGVVSRVSPRSERSAVAVPYEDHRSLSGAKPEQAVRNDAVGQASRKETHPGCRKISIVSYRKRLIDPDNLCAKFFIDALRYEGVITDDTAKHISLEVRQEKSKCERTEINIE